MVGACPPSAAPGVEDGHSAGSRRPEPRADDGLVVEGTMGSIGQVAVESAMSGHLESLGSCYREALGELSYLLGDVILSFRLDRTGGVKWVHVASSTLGHQATESCLASRAASIRFPRPQGGEAEFSYPLNFNPGSGRPPEVWNASHVAEAVGGHRAEIEACGARGEGYSITMYVGRGGRVTAAGVSCPDHEATTAADCVARAAIGWSMPDPGSWVAKVTVDL
ncbi:MAG: energy transducer TonB [Deltaproteobacteria bacterium]|nr:energy transducer TonB [Deltaproteobacteria bacterium]